MDANGPEDSVNLFNIAGVWFVYGSLKPTELGFRQIEHLIDHHEPVQLNGYRLFVRDGLPGIGAKEGGGWTVSGNLLHAKLGQESELASIIERFENPQLYEVQEVEVTNASGTGVQAAANLFKYPRKGNSEPIESSTWSVSEDAYFRYGLPTLFDMAHGSISGSTGSSYTLNFWEAYLPIMGTFLNLWTVLERYVAFAQPCINRVQPQKRQDSALPSLAEHLTALVASDAGKKALESVVNLPKRQVSRTDNVSRPVRRHIPTETWYQVRNNSAHRGKSAFKDYDLIRNSALGLSEFLVALLSQEVNGLEHLKELLDVNGMDK